MQQRQDLLALQETADEAAGTVELDQTSVGRLSRMDALQGQAMSRERDRRRQIELQKIAAALRRIEAGDYGDCVRCGEEIAIRRLDLDPAAPLCIDCASKSDESGR
jgi:DnaK suppressor protein